MDQKTRSPLGAGVALGTSGKHLPIFLGRAFMDDGLGVPKKNTMPWTSNNT